MFEEESSAWKWSVYSYVVLVEVLGSPKQESHKKIMELILNLKFSKAAFLTGGLKKL